MVLEVSSVYDQPSSIFKLLAESVTFSGRVQLLVSKLGRSSKPSPRFLVVVSSSR